MVKCADCNLEMLNPNTQTCYFPAINIEGKWYWRDREYYDVNERCHDCNIVNKKGNIHHFGCDVERCPKCGKQLISCDCKGKTIFLKEGDS